MKFFTTLFILFSIFQLKAQSITGSLQSDQGEPIPFAAITLKEGTNSTLVKATISNEDGSFKLSGFTLGNYLLGITNIGFTDYEKKVMVDNGVLSLGTIVLETSAEQLEEVTVVSEKPMVQVMADKTVFNVENTINATGTSAFELLRKAPGVIVDNNGGIILEGKTGVQIFIDDKLSVLQGEDLTNFLESLQATD
ncbi:MAG: carboxypeptidase-like regulatory domain-containing protein, partial [Croceitalea sp.]|nr:carboxypeptidase-like regulatory domain-containing protein [Croceitalea sp.]